jgi:hypothetical protein
MNKKAQGQALGVLGVIAMILIIDGVMIYFASALGQEVETKEFGLNEEECDCGTISCQEYESIYGTQKLQDLCINQEQSGFTVDVLNGFQDAPILGYIIFITNILLLIAVVIILRGGSG